jgi:hypothetical protein
MLAKTSHFPSTGSKQSQLVLLTFYRAAISTSGNKTDLATSDVYMQRLLLAAQWHDYDLMSRSESLRHIPMRCRGCRERLEKALVQQVYRLRREAAHSR